MGVTADTVSIAPARRRCFPAQLNTPATPAQPRCSPAPKATLRVINAVRATLCASKAVRVAFTASGCAGRGREGAGQKPNRPLDSASATQALE